MTKNKLTGLLAYVTSTNLGKLRDHEAVISYETLMTALEKGYPKEKAFEEAKEHFTKVMEKRFGITGLKLTYINDVYGELITKLKVHSRDFLHEVGSVEQYVACITVNKGRILKTSKFLAYLRDAFGDDYAFSAYWSGVYNWYTQSLPQRIPIEDFFPEDYLADLNSSLREKYATAQAFITGSRYANKLKKLYGNISQKELEGFVAGYRKYLEAYFNEVEIYGKYEYIPDMKYRVSKILGEEYGSVMTGQESLGIRGAYASMWRSPVRLKDIIVNYVLDRTKWSEASVYGYRNLFAMLYYLDKKLPEINLHPASAYYVEAPEYPEDTEFLYEDVQEMVIEF